MGKVLEEDRKNCLSQKMKYLVFHISNFIRKLKQWISVFRALSISGFLGSNVATLSFIGKPRTALSYIQHNLFVWRMLNRKGLPQRQFHELFSTPENVGLQVLPTRGYFTDWDAHYTKDVFYLALLAKVLSPKVVFEIGTLHGYTALLFALNTPPDTVVYTLDLPPDESCGPSLPTTVVDDAHIVAHTRCAEYLYLKHPLGKKVKQLYGDSAQFDFTPYHGAVDLFFVDGAHSYAYVRSDSLNALACTRRGG